MPFVEFSWSILKGFTYSWNQCGCCLLGAAHTSSSLLTVKFKSHTLSDSLWLSSDPVLWCLIQFRILQHICWWVSILTRKATLWQLRALLLISPLIMGNPPTHTHTQDPYSSAWGLTLKCNSTTSTTGSEGSSSWQQEQNPVPDTLTTTLN